MVKLHFSFFEKFNKANNSNLCTVVKISFASLTLMNWNQEKSIGEVSRIPRFRTGSTQKFKLRRSQSSVSSTSDVHINDAPNENRNDL